MKVQDQEFVNNVKEEMAMDGPQAARLRPAAHRMPSIDGVAIHYVGYTAVGEVQMASISILQKPLLHLYSEFLKSGGCTARKARELFFTDNGIRVAQNGDTNSNELYFHYALITYTNAVVLRTFKSHGKKLYGMFEPTSPLSFTTGDRPETLFPLEKRFSKTENILIFPLVAVLYRPDPPNNHLHCHAFACISVDQSNEVCANIQARVKSFFEDYETISVDDNIFSTPVPDFWKLTEDGWRMTMTRRKRRPQPSPDSDPEDVRGDEIVSNIRTQSKDLAVFAQAKVLSRRQNNDLFVDYRVPNSDSGVESPTAEVVDVARPPSPRSSRQIPKYVRGGVRVLPMPINHSSPEIVRRAPPIGPKPRNHRLATSTDVAEPGPPPLYVNGDASDGEQESVHPSAIWMPVVEPDDRIPVQRTDIVGKALPQSDKRKPAQSSDGRKSAQHSNIEKPAPQTNATKPVPQTNATKPVPQTNISKPLLQSNAMKPVRKTDKKTERRIPVDEPEIQSPPPRKQAPEPQGLTLAPYHKDEPDIETRPMEEWDWEEVGDQSEPEVGRFSRGKAIRRPTDPRPISPEPAPLQRGKAIRKVSDEKKEHRKTKTTTFEGPVQMSKSDSFIDEGNKSDEQESSYSHKDNEIKALLSDMIYANGIDGIERSASMMNFERSLGYLP